MTLTSVLRRSAVLAACLLLLPALGVASRADAAPVPVVINEIATIGPSGVEDEAIEIRNVSTHPVDISDWQLKFCGANNALIAVVPFPSSTILEPMNTTGEHLLIANVAGYSGPTAADLLYSGWEMPASVTVVLVNTSQLLVDRVGFARACGNPSPAERLDPRLAHLAPSMSRDCRLSINTGNNARDFKLEIPRDFQNSLSAAPVPCLTVTNPGAQTSAVGTSVTLTMTAVFGTPPYTWSATGLPPGLSIDPGSGRISGTPSTAGTYQVTVTATDSTPTTATTSFTWTVTCGPFTNGTDVPIVDNSTSYSDITISGCPGNASATSKVAVDIKHLWRADLVISLIDPNGAVHLMEDFPKHDPAANVHKTYTVDLSGITGNGTWRLKVEDGAPEDTGYIDRWALTP